MDLYFDALVIVCYLWRCYSPTVICVVWAALFVVLVWVGRGFAFSGVYVGGWWFGFVVCDLVLRFAVVGLVVWFAVILWFKFVAFVLIVL